MDIITFEKIGKAHIINEVSGFWVDKQWVFFEYKGYKIEGKVSPEKINGSRIISMKFKKDGVVVENEELKKEIEEKIFL